MRKLEAARSADYELGLRPLRAESRERLTAMLALVIAEIEKGAGAAERKSGRTRSEVASRGGLR
jgi:hypothetical protein